MNMLMTILAAIFITSTVAEARDLRVRIYNNSNVDMLYLYGSHRDRTTWGRDRLGNDIIYAGDRYVVDFERGSQGYCIFDLKAVWVDGHEHIAWGVNVCAVWDFQFRYHR